MAEGGETNISNSLFDGNSADENGGAIFSKYDIDLNMCNFTDNKAWTGGALYFVNDAVVNALIFKNNSADLKGGALFFKNNGIVNNSLFVDNRAQNGGAIEFNQTGIGCKLNF